jgi:hypothetical protein
MFAFFANKPLAEETAQLDGAHTVFIRQKCRPISVGINNVN